VPEINPVLFGKGHPVAEQSRPRWMLSDWHKAGRIITWLKANRARAVIIGGYNDLTRLRLLRWCRRAGVPCYVFADSNIHADTAKGLKRLVKNALVRWVVRQAAGIMPCGTAGQRFFERYGLRPECCFIVPYEPDYELIRTLPESDIARARADFGLDEGRKRLVACARLIPHKRIDLAIDAFSAIAPERSEWDLVIIGDGPERAALEVRVPVGLKSRITWCGFIGEQSRISAIYRASHILICPSDLEPWGVVINEAAAAGLAIVASSAVGAAAELVRDGVNGRMFPAGRLPALIDALRDATAPEVTSRYRAGSVEVLADWRHRADPIQGIRHAMVPHGLMR
jgi:glycosyltransferase involved in cell wall biosynthesis